MQLPLQRGWERMPYLKRNSQIKLLKSTNTKRLYRVFSIYYFSNSLYCKIFAFLERDKHFLENLIKV